MEINQALLVIDMQYGLVQREVFNKQILIDNINRLISFFHEQNKPVFLIRHTNNSFSIENTEDWQICSKLSLSDKDTYINKSHSSIFKEKEFLALIRDERITNVVVVGLVTNGCIQAACLDAIKLGFSTTLISDAHSTFHKDAEKVILDWNVSLKNQGVQLLSTDEYLSL